MLLLLSLVNLRSTAVRCLYLAAKVDPLNRSAEQRGGTAQAFVLERGKVVAGSAKVDDVCLLGYYYIFASYLFRRDDDPIEL